MQAADALLGQKSVLPNRGGGVTRRSALCTEINSGQTLAPKWCRENTRSFPNPFLCTLYPEVKKSVPLMNPHNPRSSSLTDSVCSAGRVNCSEKMGRRDAGEGRAEENKLAACRGLASNVRGILFAQILYERPWQPGAQREERFVAAPRTG